MRKQTTEERTLEYIGASFELKMQALGLDIDREKVVVMFGDVECVPDSGEFITIEAKEQAP